MCTMYVLLEVRRGHWIPEVWNYRVTIWILEIELRLTAKASSLTQLSSPFSPFSPFLYLYVNISIRLEVCLLYKRYLLSWIIKYIREKNGTNKIIY